MKATFLLLLTIVLFATAHAGKPGLGDKLNFSPITGNKATAADSTGSCLNDAQFLISAYNAGIFEVKASKLARRMTGDKKVRQFAAMVSANQEVINKDLLALLLIKGYTAPAQPPAELKTKFKYLNEWMGNDFNRKYTTGNITAQKQAIDMYAAIYLDSGDMDIRYFASVALAQLQKDLDSGQNLLIHINRPHPSGW